MARIAGVDLPRNKRIEIALTYIYGIGRHAANVVLDAGRHLARQAQRRSRRERRPQDPRRDRERTIRVEGDLRRDAQLSIKRLMDLGCVPRLAPSPRTCRCAASARHTNARTRKVRAAWR